MNIEDKVDIDIHATGYGGDGIGRLPDGMTVFVPFAVPGDRVRVRLAQLRKRFAKGEIDSIESPAETRVSPRCPLFGRCGGCRYQQIDDKTELAQKVDQLRGLLQRMGKLNEIPEIELPSNAAAWAYRNKVVLHRNETNDWGFFALDNRAILPLEECPIACDAINQVICRGELQLGRGDDLILRCDADGQVFQSADDGRGDILLTERLNGAPVQVPQAGFYQVHPAVLNELLNWVRDAVAGHGGTLVDAYCGVGVFTLGLANLFERTVGIEGYAPAIPVAVRNAKIWSLPASEFILGAVEDFLPDQLARIDGPATILLDPPRSGCRPKVLRSIQKEQPSKLVYVACDPTSLARDLKTLSADGRYALRRLALFNMFPQTAHFETVAVLSPA